MKKTILIIIFLLIIVATVVYFLDFSQPQMTWGVTFSQQYAQNELGLDWRQTYLAILDDLRVDRLRLSAYWNQNEPYKGQYNFGDLDWQINEATKRGVEIILGVGRKLPRWPECHDPGWLKNWSQEEIEGHQRQFITAVINRYKSNPNITAWQVENEPFLKLFGECPAPDKNFLRAEIALVRNLDSRPVIVTDSGELHWWLKASSVKPDIIGTTLYRVVYNQRLGYFHHVLPSSFYAFRTWLVKKLFGVNKVIVAELQAEAWHVADKSLAQMELAEQLASMDVDQFRKNLKFAKKAGFAESYLWGAEWWYFLKEKKNYPDFWQEAQKLWP